MASSKPLHEGQIPISCQLCEESNEIKWKCIECDFLLCTKCQKIHEKVKSTYQHTIIDIKDIASQQQQAKENKDFHNIPCEIHSGQNCCIFCQTCDEVICPSCITITHTKHNMIELVKGYEQTVKKLKTFNSEIDKQLANYERGRSNLSTFKSSEDIKYEREKQKIMSREKLLKDEVEMHTKSLLKELDQRWDLQSKLVKDADIKSKKINKDLEYRTECLTNAFSSV
ncbi:E3 ubiquitin-protein ligase TRIM45-like [Mytilus trossulus]|uniref:E3 ubiquitin-protein ligase TRIM45-like n=1 Tax=Mytilus trossulus TaxID=6551 RepID=UPI003003FB55